MSYTYAILKLSRAAFTEIMQKLEDTGYSDQFDKDEDGNICLINMHGLALRPEDGRPDETELLSEATNGTS